MTDVTSTSLLLDFIHLLYLHIISDEGLLSISVRNRISLTCSDHGIESLWLFLFDFLISVRFRDRFNFTDHFALSGYFLFALSRLWDFFWWDFFVINCCLSSVQPSLIWFDFFTQFYDSLIDQKFYEHVLSEFS